MDGQASTSGRRLVFMDNLRSFVILLVVVMHSNVTYSGMGSWYYMDDGCRTIGPVAKLLFGLYGSFTQAWFMGILFFLSGFLAAKSLTRRTPGVFIRERLFRLGAPLLAFMLIIHPLTVYAFWDHGRIMHSTSLWHFYRGFIAEGQVWGATGPLWFAQALLMFSVFYAVWRFLRKVDPQTPGNGSVPRGVQFLLIALGTGVAAFLVRLRWPIGTSFMNLQFGFFVSYIALFILGVRGGERGWFNAVTAVSGKRWLTAGLLGIPVWFALILCSGAAQGQPSHIEGGWHWQAAAYALWEGGVAIAMSLGLVVFFRRFVSWDHAFLRLLSRHSFRIYMFHTPVLVALSVAVAGWHAPMLLKHVVVAPLACFASLLVAMVLSRVPGVEPITR